MPPSKLAVALLTVAVPTASLAGQTPSTSMAVLPFEDSGSYGQTQEDFTALERGIAGMLVWQLARHPDAKVAGRREVQRLLDDKRLEAGTHVNAADATDVGKTAGVRYVVFGTFVDLYGEFRIDARIVDVTSGRIVQVATANDDRVHLNRLLNRITLEILADVQLPPLADSSLAALADRNISIDAMTYFGRGLVAQDQGDGTSAVDFYRQALEIEPDYAEAREELLSAGGS